MGNIVTKLVMFCLKKSKLSIENKALLTTCLLDTLVALPLRDMIYKDEKNRLVVNDKLVTLDVARSLSASAEAAQSNLALRFIREQVTYVAVTLGVHKLEKAEQSFFYRAALWWGQQEKQFLDVLAGERELDA